MRRSLIIISTIIVIFITSILLWIIFREPHWSLIEIEDLEPRPFNLSQDIKEIKPTYEIAKKRVDEWRTGTHLHDIMIDFVGIDQISNRKGLIRYFFYIKNNDLDGIPHVIAIVDIDTDKQETVRFEVFGGFDLGGRKLDISGWEIDILEAMSIAEKYLGTEYYEQYSNPMVRIRSQYDNKWTVEYHPNKDSYMPEKSVAIDAITGEILRIKE